MKKQKVLVIVGPTSSGKSALAVRLAKIFNGEIISADSRQVYRGLDIGTGKITKREMCGVRHYLLDVASPQKTFTAYDFVEKARAAIASIAARGKLPIIAGGSGFYIDALLGRVSLSDVPANRKLRARLGKMTAAQLFALLKQRDARRAAALASPSERGNKVRLIRALEIAAALGTVPQYSGFVNPNFDILWIGVSVPKETLHKKIRARLLARLKQGMVSEAARLHKAGLSYKRMEELGLEYRSLARLLRGAITREELIAELDIAIRRYAKRQRTYWRRNGEILWFRSNEITSIRFGDTGVDELVNENGSMTYALRARKV